MGDLELISIDEMCDILHIGKNAAYKILGSGEMPCFRMSRAWKIPREAVTVYINRQCEKFEQEMHEKAHKTGKRGRPRKIEIDAPYYIK